MRRPAPSTFARPGPRRRRACSRRLRRSLLAGAAAAIPLLPGPGPAPALAQAPTGAEESAGAEASASCPCPSLVAEYPVYLPVEPPEAYRRAVARGTRSEDGRPGPDYWQQAADYDIRVELDPASGRLRGSGTVTYENGSPRALSGVLLRLYQNVFSQGVERNRAVRITGGMELTRLAAQGETLESLDPARIRAAQLRGEPPPAGYMVQGTLAQLVLPEPIPPGGSAELEFDWAFEVPGEDAFRMGHIDRRVFNIAQWYPQVAVLDDVYGLDTTPYLGDGEFYLEYGSFDVAVTVPAGWLVAATGELVNAEEVLPPEARARLEAALVSDTVVRVVSAADLDAGAGSGGQSVGAASGGEGAGDPEGVTWRYHADGVRDFAFAASDLYVWDAVGAEVGGERGRVRVGALYDPSIEHWSEAARFSKHAIEFFSEQILPYPYPHATAVYGPVGGMEYPMLVFIGRSGPGEPLYSVLAHEFSHEWFPMLVGSVEADYAWMDEGLTTFNEALARADFYGNQNARLQDMERYLQAVRLDIEAPLMQHTDHVESGYGRAVAAYMKPGTLLHALRAVLGPDTFDRAYRAYAEAWSHRHPYPWDFFNVMETEAGRDLDWFWRPWFYETWTLDQAIDGIRATEGGLEVTVSNLGDAVLPVVLEVETDGGTTRRVRWPAEAWAGTRRLQREVRVPGTVVRVELDPDRVFPDTDRENNVWRTGEGGR